MKKKRPSDEILSIIIDITPEKFKNLSDEFKKDREFVLLAVKANGYCFEYADETIKKDREFILEAVSSSNAGVLRYADESFRKDREIVLSAVKSDGHALQYADQSFAKDREIVLSAVERNGYAIKYADVSFKKDRVIVLAAVQSDALNALGYIDESFKKDREIMLAAVKSNGATLKYADVSFKKDMEIVTTALKSDSYSLNFVNKTLKNRLIDLINMFVEDHNVIHSWDEKDILTLDKLIKNEVRGERQEIFGLDQKPGIDLYYYSKDPFSNSKEDNIWVPKDIKKKDLPFWNSRNIYFFESFLNIDFVEKENVMPVVVSKIYEPQPKLISGTKLFEGAVIEAFYIKELGYEYNPINGLGEFRQHYKGIKSGTTVEFRFVKQIAENSEEAISDLYCCFETLGFDEKCQMMKNKFYSELGKDIKKAELALKKWKRELFII